MHGKIIRVGTFDVAGERLTGVMVQVQRELLEALAACPLYRDVTLIESGGAVMEGESRRRLRRQMQAARRDAEASRKIADGMLYRALKAEAELARLRALDTPTSACAPGSKVGA